MHCSYGILIMNKQTMTSTPEIAIQVQITEQNQCSFSITGNLMMNSLGTKTLMQAQQVKYLSPEAFASFKGLGRSKGHNNH